jgi:DHA2 family multidrug resistance protein
MAEQRPQIPYFKEFLPTPVCIVLSLFFAMVFQFNGGVFLPAATQMSSALGCIQEDVTMAGYASFIGMLMVVWICVMCLTRTIRLGKKIPLYGIDWIGLLLWTVMLFAIVFICIYGDFYDWLDSVQIRSCIVIAVVSLLININRMTSIRHPYIDPQVFRYKKFPVVLFLFLMLCLFLTTSSVLQNAFMTSILQYDTLNAISLNWCVFAGILAGAGIVFFRQAVLKEGYKLLISVGFTLIVMYQYYMYFLLIYPDLNIESLYLPNFLKGIGHGVLYISLTIYVAKHIPFKHFFQSLCVLSFIRTSIATPLGAAILNRWMKHLQRDNWGLLSRNMDNLHEWMPDVSLMQLYEEVNTQTMLTSLKELFGWICLLGTVFLVIVLSYRIWRDRHLAALKMLHSLPVKKRYRPSSIHKISKN